MLQPPVAAAARRLRSAPFRNPAAPVRPGPPLLRRSAVSGAPGLLRARVQPAVVAAALWPLRIWKSGRVRVLGRRPPALAFARPPFAVLRGSPPPGGLCSGVRRRRPGGCPRPARGVFPSQVSPGGGRGCPFRALCGPSAGSSPGFRPGPLPAPPAGVPGRCGGPAALLALGLSPASPPPLPPPLGACGVREASGLGGSRPRPVPGLPLRFRLLPAVLPPLSHCPQGLKAALRLASLGLDPLRIFVSGGLDILARS